MITFVIPVYRSSGNLKKLLTRICDVFQDRLEKLEVVFVEDCGGDDSWEVIQDLCRAHTWVRGFKMSRNYGQHNALLCGIREARGDVVVTLDDDLQHPPEEVPKLLVKLEEGVDVVYGPPEKEQHGLFRDLASQITKLALQGAMGAQNARQVSAFRVFRTRLRDAFLDYRCPSVNIDVLLTWATNRFGYVKVSHDAREFGESGYNTRKLMRHAFNMMTGFSTLPLQVASVAGFGMALFGIGILCYVLGSWALYGSAVPGFVFLASIISIFSGAQLIALGIIGEYLARMYSRSMDRPAFVVAEQAGCDAP